MSRPFVRALLLALGFAAIAGARAEETAAPVPAAPPLTLEECIARALQRNFTLKIQDFSTDIARESLNAAKAAFEPTFTATATRAVSQQSTSTSTLDGAPTIGPRSDTTDTRLGVSQPITTGATLGLSTSLDRRATNSTFSTLNPAYNSDVALTVSQPLLKGAGTAVNRAAIERTQLGVSIATLDFESQVLQVVRDTEAAYYNLVFAREQKLVKEHSLELAQQLYDENKNRKAAGVATLNIGLFINALVKFLIVAIVLFVVVKSINMMKRQAAKDPAPEVPAPPTKEEVLLTEIRDALLVRTKV